LPIPQQAAFTILEIDRGSVEPNWLREQFSRRQIRRIQTHIKFGDYWYTANAQFKDLKEFTSQLARDNGLDLSPENAWRWLAQGGFIDEDLTVGAGGFNLVSIRSSSAFLTDLAADSPLEETNILRLDLAGAVREETAAYGEGRVVRSAAYLRNGKVLPLRGQFGILVQILQKESRLPAIVDMVDQMAKQRASDPAAMMFLSMLPEALEGMIRDGWVKATYDPRLPRAALRSASTGFRLNKDTAG
jgi:hypothetical protein